MKNSRNQISSGTALTFAAAVVCSISYESAMAGPEGGNVTAGRGSITQSDLNTVIQQQTNRMAIDWQSFNVGLNESVQFIQPDAQSIVLNNILGNDGSLIQGSINANGHVIFVNPNGVFFTETSTVNVGGLIASGLRINIDDFINGNLLFSAEENTTGKIVNAGVIEASLGGSVTLLGKQVENSGLISANLGAVNLAAGKGAVLQFDSAGLLGVRITDAILQEELGIDPAVLNQGEINAFGGRILLTGSTSRDVFSQAVNTGDMSQRTSVVMHDDGSFTLGSGANVVNSGQLDVSANTDVGVSVDAGSVVVLGENIDNHGSVIADNLTGENMAAGFIEIHARDTNIQHENANISALNQTGAGGSIYLLGKNVGLFGSDTHGAHIHADGSLSGGVVLLGGDLKGENSWVPNSEFIFLNENSHISVNGVNAGDGGNLIAFANDTARIYGLLSATGGELAGRGGFIETSGKLGFDIRNTPNISSVDGGGEWLIDPRNIEIVPGSGQTGITQDPTNTFTSSDGNTATIGIDLILDALKLAGGVTVTLVTGEGGSFGQGALGNVDFLVDMDIDGIGSGDTLRIDSTYDIDFNGFDIADSDTGTADQLNLDFNLDTNLNDTGGLYLPDDTQIFTYGGDISVVANFVSSGNSLINTAGGNLIFDTDIGVPQGETEITFGSVTLGNIELGSGDLTINPATNIYQSSGTTITTSGLTTLYAQGEIVLQGANDFNQLSIIEAERAQINDINAIVLGDILINDVNAGTTNLSITTNGSITQLGGTHIENQFADGGGVGSISYFDAGAANNVLLFEDANDFATVQINSANNVDIHEANDLRLEASTISGTLDIDIITTGDLDQVGAVSVAGHSTFTLGAANNMALNDTDNNFSSVEIVSANNVTLRENNGLSIGNSTISGNLDLLTLANDITQTAGSVSVVGNTILAAGGSITLNNSGNNFSTLQINDSGSTGAVNTTIADVDSIVLDRIIVSGNLDVTAGDGTITQAGTVAGNAINTGSATFSVANATPGSATINLNNLSNSFTSVQIDQADAATLFDAANLQVSVTNPITNLTLRSQMGSITQSGLINVSNLLNVQAGDIINLSNSGNLFNLVELISSGASADNQIYDADGFQLNATSITGNLVIDTGTGTVAQNGAVDISVGGTTTFNSVGDVTFNQGIVDFGGVVSTGANVGAFTLVDDNSLTLGNVTATSIDLTANNGGDISQTGALVVTGTSSFTVDDGQSIQLGNAGNNLQAAIAFNAATGNLLNIDFTNLASIDLAATDITGSLTLESTGGGITQSGAWVIGGTTGLTLATPSAVDLSNTNNNFAGAVSINNAAAVQLNDIDNLILGAIDASSLTVTAQSINQILSPGAGLNITGAASFTADANQNISLQNTDNALQGLISFIAASGTLQSVSLINNDNIDLGAMALLGNLSLETVAVNGAITQSSAWDIDGTATLTSSTNITLLQAGNDFTGAVSIGNAAAVQLNDSNNLILGSVAADSLSVTSQSITQAGAWGINGTTSLTLTTLSDVALLQDNDFSGALNVSNAAALQINDVNNLMLGAIDASSLTVTAQSIGQLLAPNTGLDITGVANFTAASGQNITLLNTNNALQSAIIFAASGGGNLLDLSLINNANIDLGTTTLLGDLTLESVAATGVVTQSGVWDIDGETTLTLASPANVTLMQANDFTGSVSVTNADAVQINDVNQLVLGAIDANTLSVTAQSIDQLLVPITGLEITGAANFTAASGQNITLANTNNALQGAITFAASSGNLQSVSLINNDDIDLGTTTLLGDLTLESVAGTGVITQSGVWDIGGATALTLASPANVTLMQTNDFTGAVTIANADNVQLNDVNQLMLGAIDANSLTVTAQSIDQLLAPNTGLDITGVASFTAASGQNIALLNTNNALQGAITFAASGGNLQDLSLINNASIDLGNTTLLGDLNLESVAATGVVTQSGVWDIDGLTTLTLASPANVTLMQANDFTGSVSVMNADAVQINDVNQLVLGAIDANTLSVSAQSIDQLLAPNAGLDVSGAANFTAASGQNITLANANNALQGAITFAASGGGSLQSLSLTNNTNIDLGATIILGDLTLESVAATGLITQSGGWDVGGTTTLTLASPADITLTEANDFIGAVTIANADAVQINDVNQLMLGAIAANTLSVSAQSIDQLLAPNAGLDITGVANFTAASGQNIALLNTNNALQGAITFSASGGGNLQDLALINNANINLSNTTLLGDLTLESVAATGVITQSGVWDIDGVTTLTLASPANVTLTQNNDFTGAVIVANADAVQLNDVNQLVLGAIDANTLSVTAQSIDQLLAPTTRLDITGAADFTAASGQNISLANTNNMMQGAITFAASSGNLQSVSLINNDDIDLGVTTLLGDLTLESVAANGEITQSGAWNITGVTNLTLASPSNVTLLQANDFTGAVNITNGADVSLNDIDTLTLGDISAVNLTATAQNINQIDEDQIISAGLVGLDISGVSDFTVASGQSVVLLNPNNAMQGNINFYAQGGGSLQDITLVNNSDIDFGATTLLGDLTLESTAPTGEITQSGVWDIDGATTLTLASAADITLQLGNDFSGAVNVINGADVQITDINSFTLGDITANTLIVNAQNISQIDENLNNGTGLIGLAISGDAEFTVASGQNIELLNPNNAMRSSISFVANGGGDLQNITLVNNESIDFGATNLLGDLTLESTLDTGVITQSGAWIVAGATSLTLANAADVTLIEANDFGGAVNIINGNAVQLTDVNLLTLGDITAATLSVTAESIDQLNENQAVSEGLIGLVVTGSSDFTIDAGQDLLLGNINNNLQGVINILPAGGANLQNLTLYNNAGIQLAGLVIDNDLLLTSNATGTAISQTGGFNVVGDAQFVAANGHINLENDTNNFNVISIDAQSASIRDSNTGAFTNDLTLGAINLTASSAPAGQPSLLVQVDNGSLLQQNGTAITNIGDPAVIEAVTDLSVDNGFDITLSSLNNDFDILRLSDTGNNGSISVVDVNSVSLAQGTFNNVFTLNAGGDITQQDTLRFNNDVSFISTNNVLLDNNGNNFSAVAIDAASASLFDNDAIALMDINVTQNTGESLRVEANGNITQRDNTSVTVAAGSLSTFNATGGAVNLVATGSNNNFSTISGNAQGFDVADINNIVLGDITVSGGGTLEVNVGGGITDSGNLVANGDSNFYGGDAEVVALNGSGHQLSGQITIGSQTGTLQNVTLTNNGATTLGDITASNNFTLDSTGVVTQVNGSLISVGNQASIAANDATSSRDITLAGDNQVDTLQVRDANNLRFNNASDLNVQDVSSTGDVNITAPNLNVNGVIDAQNIALGGNGGVVAINSSLSTSGALNVSGEGINLGNNISAQNITLDSLSGQVTQSGELIATDGDIVVAGGSYDFSGATLTANNGLVDINIENTINAGNIASTGVLLVANTGDINATGNINSSTNDIEISAGQHFAMNGSSQVISDAANINISSAGNSTVSSLVAENGVISVDAGIAINATGGTDPHLVSPELRLNAVNGIGDGGNLLITQTTDLYAINVGGDGSEVDIQNFGEVNIQQLHNQGAISFVNDRDINIAPNGIDAGILPGSYLQLTSGESIYGIGPVTATSSQNPDVKAYNATFNAFGDFGSYTRPLFLHVINLADGAVGNLYTPLYSPIPLQGTDNIRSEFTFGSFESIGTSGDQLVEVETLDEVDPAIFTDVRNYIYNDISIRLPRDQLYEDEFEDEDEVAAF